MKILEETSFVGLDFEFVSTVFNHYPVEIGIVEMFQLNILPDSFYSSQFTLPATDDEKKRKLPDVWHEIKFRLHGKVIVAHGHGTEKHLLRNIPFHRFVSWIDTLNLSRKIFPKLPSYTLNALILHFSLQEEAKILLPSFQWHDALSDALATILLLKKIIIMKKIEKFPLSLLIR